MGFFDFLRTTKNNVRGARLGAETQKILGSYYQFVIEDYSVLKLANAMSNHISDPHKLAVIYLTNFIEHDLNIINEGTRKTVEMWIERASYAKDKGAPISELHIEKMMAQMKIKFG